MAKSLEQLFALERQQIERSKLGFESAKAKSQPDLVSLNLGQGLKACLMQGLIAWRCGLTSPVSAFREGLTFVRQGYSTWQTMNGSSAAKTLHLPLEKGLFLAFLLNEDAVAPDLNDLVADGCDPSPGACGG